jgi:hypothetical protein
LPDFKLIKPETSTKVHYMLRPNSLAKSKNILDEHGYKKMTANPSSANSLRPGSITCGKIRVHETELFHQKSQSYLVLRSRRWRPLLQKSDPDIYDVSRLSDHLSLENVTVAHIPKRPT